MDDTSFSRFPVIYHQLVAKCSEIGFTMPSDQHIGALLRTLVASKPAGNFVEFGTGIGLSLCWMQAGMDQKSRLTTIDNDPELIQIASAFFGDDARIEIIDADGADWIRAQAEESLDLIFADAWPGKYSDLAATLELLKPGGLYVIDDMTTQASWPEGHAGKRDALVASLEARSDLFLTKMNWSSGVIVATKR